jgi:hypothetical protein
MTDESYLFFLSKALSSWGRSKGLLAKFLWNYSYQHLEPNQFEQMNKCQLEMCKISSLFLLDDMSLKSIRPNSDIIDYHQLKEALEDHGPGMQMLLDGLEGTSLSAEVQKTRRCNILKRLNKRYPKSSLIVLAEKICQNIRIHFACRYASVLFDHYEDLSDKDRASVALLLLSYFKAEILHASVGQKMHEEEHFAVEYEVANLGPSRVVRELRPGLVADGIVYIQARVVLSR